MRRRDAGFTLIELLVTVGILGVVAVPVATGVFQGISLTGQSADRLTTASQHYRLTRLLLEDVQSATTVGTTGGPECETPAGASALLWVQGATATRYVVVDGARLVRITCADGSQDVLAAWSGATAQAVCLTPDPCRAVTVTVPADRAAPFVLTAARRTS